MDKWAPTSTSNTWKWSHDWCYSWCSTRLCSRTISIQRVYQRFDCGNQHAMTRSMESTSTITIIKILLYADDIVLLHPDHKSLQIALDTCSRWSQKWGMTFAPHKSKLMRLGYVEAKNSMPKLANQPLEYVNQFKYLGVIFNDNHRKKYLDKSETVATIDQDLKQKAFLFSKKAACPVDVIALLLHSCFMPKLLYGSEVFPIQSKVLETYQGKLAKTALCTYDTHPIQKLWISLVGKVSNNNKMKGVWNFYFVWSVLVDHEIWNIALSAFNDQNPVKWVKTIHMLLNEIEKNDNTQLAQNHVQSFAMWIWKVQPLFQKQISTSIIDCGSPNSPKTWTLEPMSTASGGIRSKWIIPTTWNKICVIYYGNLFRRCTNRSGIWECKKKKNSFFWSLMFTLNDIKLQILFLFLFWFWFLFFVLFFVFGGAMAHQLNTFLFLWWAAGFKPWAWNIPDKGTQFGANIEKTNFLEILHPLKISQSNRFSSHILSFLEENGNNRKKKQEQRGSKWELWCLPPIIGAAPLRSWEGTPKCDSMRRDSRRTIV